MRSIGNSIWTGEAIATLRKLWDEGHSCSQIAAKMGRGITRNAVIGKAHRLGLTGRSNNVNSQRRAVEPRPPGTPRASPINRHPKSVFKSREIKPRIRVVNPPAKPGLMTVLSVLTGSPLPVRRRQSLGREMTKNEMRSMLTLAVQNTAAMEVS